MPSSVLAVVTQAIIEFLGAFHHIMPFIAALVFLFRHLEFPHFQTRIYLFLSSKANITYASFSPFSSFSSRRNAISKLLVARMLILRAEMIIYFIMAAIT